MVFVRVPGRCITGLTENLFIARITWRVPLAFAARINPNLPERARTLRVHQRRKNRAAFAFCTRDVVESRFRLAATPR